MAISALFKSKRALVSRKNEYEKWSPGLLVSENQQTGFFDFLRK